MKINSIVLILLVIPFLFQCEYVIQEPFYEEHDPDLIGRWNNLHRWKTDWAFEEYIFDSTEYYNSVTLRGFCTPDSILCLKGETIIYTGNWHTARDSLYLESYDISFVMVYNYSLSPTKDTLTLISGKVIENYIPSYL